MAFSKVAIACAALMIGCTQTSATHIATIGDLLEDLEDLDALAAEDRPEFQRVVNALCDYFSAPHPGWELIESASDVPDQEIFWCQIFDLYFAIAAYAFADVPVYSDVPVTIIGDFISQPIQNIELPSGWSIVPSLRASEMFRAGFGVGSSAPAHLIPDLEGKSTLQVASIALSASDDWKANFTDAVIIIGLFALSESAGFPDQNSIGGMVKEVTDMLDATDSNSVITESTVTDLSDVLVKLTLGYKELLVQTFNEPFKKKNYLSDGPQARAFNDPVAGNVSCTRSEKPTNPEKPSRRQPFTFILPATVANVVESGLAADARVEDIVRGLLTEEGSNSGLLVNTLFSLLAKLDQSSDPKLRELYCMLIEELNYKGATCSSETPGPF